MVTALSYMAEATPDDVLVRVVALRNAQPVVALAANSADVKMWSDRRISTNEFRRRLAVNFAGDERPSHRQHSSLRKVDLAVGPGRFLSEFGLPGYWIRANADVSAELSSVVAPGVVGYARAFVPVYDKDGPVNYDARYGELRPGSAAASYLWPLGAQSFATITVGAFEMANWRYDSFGCVTDFKHYSTSGKWAFGGSVAYVSPARYRVLDDLQKRYRVWEFAWSPSDNPYEVWLGYRFLGVDLSVVARWGRYLIGDHAWRLDINRSFGETKVTVFGIKSDAYSSLLSLGVRQNTRLLGGFRIELPLPPRQRGMPDRFRVTTTSSFAWSYRYRSGTTGIDVSTQHSVEETIGGYNPVTILNNLERARMQMRALGQVDSQPGNTFSSVGEP
jgi:hypothetical protein